tara:strand:- start:12972 stop:13259 length:288 start_codon:yes stop_codon:yes gene_type:complete
MKIQAADSKGRCTKVTGPALDVETPSLNFLLSRIHLVLTACSVENVTNKSVILEEGAAEAEDLDERCFREIGSAQVVEAILQSFHLNLIHPGLRT